MATKDKPIFSLTIGEFIEALQEGLGVVKRNSDNYKEEQVRQRGQVKKHYVYGLKGLCSLLGCSVSTAARIKKSGVIDAAISQVGKLIVVDADLAIDLLKVKNGYIRK